MSPPITPHPSPTDLASFAQEKLGHKKTQRVLDHCKECPDCAEQLLEAVREQSLAARHPALSKLNWIFIGLLIVALLTVVAVFWWISRSASRPLATGFERSQAAQAGQGRIRPRADALRIGPE